MSCSLPKNNTQTDILLMQLKREIEQHKNDVTAQLLIHDKKIAELCCYIKDNLSSEIRVLLDTMNETGELDQIITDTVLSSVSVLQAKTDHIVNVIEKGVVGDGATDDTVAIKRAIEYCNDTLFFPKGVYRIEGDIDIAKNDVKISGEGAVFVFPNKTRIVFNDSNNVKISGIKCTLGGIGLVNVNGFDITGCSFFDCEYGVIGSHCYVGMIERCEFNGCAHGVVFDKNLLASDLTPDHNSIFVQKCKFYNNSNPFIIRGGYVGGFSENVVEGNEYGVLFGGVADYDVRNNYFEYNKGTIITVAEYNHILPTDIRIGGNRIFGDGSNTLTGMLLTGTIIGLVLETNSWGGLLTLIDKTGAILSRPVLFGQVNNTSKEFPNFSLNMTTIDGTVILQSKATAPTIQGGRLYATDNTVCAQTKLGDYVLDYKLGYVPQLNVAPADGEGLMWKLPSGKLQVKINGVVKTIAFE